MSSKLVGVKRFGSGWEQVSDLAEESPVTVLRKPPAPSNVYVKTGNESGFLRPTPEARKFDPSDLEQPAPRIAPPKPLVAKPQPRTEAPKPSPPPRAPKPKTPAKKRDPERHREYMRRYMAARRAKQRSPQAEA